MLFSPIWLNNGFLECVYYSSKQFYLNYLVITLIWWSLCHRMKAYFSHFLHFYISCDVIQTPRDDLHTIWCYIFHFIFLLNPVVADFTKIVPWFVEGRGQACRDSFGWGTWRAQTLVGSSQPQTISAVFPPSPMISWQNTLPWLPTKYCKMPNLRCINICCFWYQRIFFTTIKFTFENAIFVPTMCQCPCFHHPALPWEYQSQQCDRHSHQNRTRRGSAELAWWMTTTKTETQTTICK